jgi:hypothetical protein
MRRQDKSRQYSKETKGDQAKHTKRRKGKTQAGKHKRHSQKTRTRRRGPAKTNHNSVRMSEFAGGGGPNNHESTTNKTRLGEKSTDVVKKTPGP